MKHGDLRRAQEALRTERTRVKDERLLVERARRGLEVEREQHRREVADLRAELGRVTAEVTRLEGELARANQGIELALARQQAAEHALRVASPSPVTPAVTPARPQSLRPTVLPPIEHRAIPVRAQEGRDLGYRATCTCGWRSSFERLEAQALQAGAVHTDRMLASQRSRHA